MNKAFCNLLSDSCRSLFCDLTFWFYLTETVVAALILILFVHWWRKAGAEEVFKTITFLMLGVIVDKGLSAVARFYRYVDPDVCEALLSSAYWALREIVFLSALIYFLWRMYSRYYTVGRHLIKDQGDK